MKVTVLGCGGSGGVPLVGGVWGNCDPSDPRNRRRRPSMLLEHDGGRMLVDTSPDLRMQLLDAGVDALDAVLFTHAHADHCHGIDDLRPLVYRRHGPIDAYGAAETMDALTHRFDYAFEAAHATGAFYGPLLRGHVVPHYEPFDVCGLTCVGFPQRHGDMPTSGFRIGPVGYSPDAAEIEESALRVLAGVRLWIVDCLRYEPHMTHAHFERTLEWIARVRPERAILTHMNHTLDYEDLAGRCPPGVEPGYDGLVAEVHSEANGQ